MWNDIAATVDGGWQRLTTPVVRWWLTLHISMLDHDERETKRDENEALYQGDVDTAISLQNHIHHLRIERRRLVVRLHKLPNHT